MIHKDKDEVKRLGANWDIARKIWFIENEPDLMKLWKWLPEKYKNQKNTSKKKKNEKGWKDFLSSSDKKMKKTYLE